MTSNRTHDGVDETLEQLIEDLTCQLCGRSPRPEDQRWYRCSELHHICELCVEIRKMESIESCSCQAMISKKIDKVTEALMKLKTWKFKCRHCFESFAREDFNVHESGCDQRLVPCLVADYNETKCSLMVKLVDILLHFESTHQKISVCRSGVTYTTKGNCSKSNLTNFTLSPSKIVAYGKIFIIFSIFNLCCFTTETKLSQTLGSKVISKSSPISNSYTDLQSCCCYCNKKLKVAQTFI